MKSMTGMGRAHGQVRGVPVKIEIKTVNHRYCEVNVRVPSRLGFLEIPAQQTIKAKLHRGKVDVYITEERSAKPAEADLEAFRACLTYLDGIRQDLGLSEPVSLSHLLSGASAWLQTEMNADDAWREFAPILESALSDLTTMREREGRELKNDIAARFAVLDVIRKEVVESADVVAEELRKKLMARVAEKMVDLTGLDPQRLNQEVVFYLDRLDISEELARLSSHLNQAAHFLSVKEAVGRKLDFLLQEINREFNTIASKCQNAPVAHRVVDAKVELEKIREQVQNIE